MSEPIDTTAIQALENAAMPGWEERWLPIPGVVGYDVSDFGNVRSYLRKGNYREKVGPAPRLLKIRVREQGQRRAAVSLPGPEGRYGNRSVHRLVMAAFVGPCPPGMEVAHLNGDATDNRLVNLIYATHVVNESHKRGHGTVASGERNGHAKLQGWQVAEMKYLAERGIPQARIAALFDIPRTVVSDVITGKSWSEHPARTDVPALLAEVERQRILIAALDHAGNVLCNEIERLTPDVRGFESHPRNPADCPVCRHALGLPEAATLVLSPEIWCDVCGAWHIPTSCSVLPEPVDGAEQPRTGPRAANGPGMALGDTPHADDAGEVQS